MERNHYLRIRHKDQETVVRFDDWITGDVVSKFSELVKTCMNVPRSLPHDMTLTSYAAEAAESWSKIHPENEAIVVNPFDAEIDI